MEYDMEIDGWMVVTTLVHRDSFVSKYADSLPQSKAHCGRDSFPLTAEPQHAMAMMMSVRTTYAAQSPRAAPSRLTFRPKTFRHVGQATSIPEPSQVTTAKK